jgi:hypothetical protein
MRIELPAHCLLFVGAQNACHLAHSRMAPVGESRAIHGTSRRKELDAESALTTLTTEKLLKEESIRRPRIALVAAGFPPSVTASVVWLSEQGVDLSLIQYHAYKLEDDQVVVLVVSFSRLFPVPDIEAFTIGQRSESQIDVAKGPLVPRCPARASSRAALRDPACPTEPR